MAWDNNKRNITQDVWGKVYYHINMKETSEILQDIKRRLQMSNVELAKLMGVPPRTFDRWINNQIEGKIQKEKFVLLEDFIAKYRNKFRFGTKTKINELRMMEKAKTPMEKEAVRRGGGIQFVNQLEDYGIPNPVPGYIF